VENKFQRGAYMLIFWNK